MVSPNRVHQAVQAAKEGRRQEARDLLLRVVADDPKNEIAWIWLSDLNEDLASRVMAIEKALELRPGHPVLLARLNELREAAHKNGQASSPQAASVPRKIDVPEKPPLSPAEKISEPPRAEILQPAVRMEEFVEPKRQEDWVVFAEETSLNIYPEAAVPPPVRSSDYARQTFRSAKALAKEGRREEALQLLQELASLEPNHVQVWLLMAELHKSLDDQIESLEKALALRPNQMEAQKNLEQLKKIQADPWLQAMRYEDLGELELAKATYFSISMHSRLPAERIEANRRILDLKLRQESEQIKPVNPTLNLYRLATGPILLFFMLIFIQAGLNPLQIGIPWLVGLAGVSTGSLLITVTGLRPMHHGWIKMFGKPGSHGETEARVILRTVGWFLLLVPIVFFYIEAGMRLVRLWVAVVSQYTP